MAQKKKQVAKPEEEIPLSDSDNFEKNKLHLKKLELQRAVLNKLVDLNLNQSHSIHNIDQEDPDSFLHY